MIDQTRPLESSSSWNSNERPKPNSDCWVYPDLDEQALARELGVTIRTLRKRLARLEEMGYVVNHRSWVEMSDALVLDDDCVFMADLPPLTDEEFAQLQETDGPDEFLRRHAGDLAGRRLFVDLPRAVVTARPAPWRALQPEAD